MSITCTYYDATTGQIDGAITAPLAEVEFNLPAGCAYVEGVHDARVTYLPGGAATARPQLPGLPASNGFPLVLDLSAYPDGCQLQVTNESGGVLELTTPSESITLEDPGDYLIHVEPPFPHIRTYETLTVLDQPYQEPV